MTRTLGAREITTRLRGKWHGKYGRSLCPVCGGSKDNPPFSVQDTPKGIAVYCHKGCDWRAIRAALGLEDGRSDVRTISDEDRAAMEAEKREADRKSSAFAMKVWGQSGDPHGSPVARYLKSRAINADALPPSIRFHAACRHPIDEGLHAAMVALIQGGEHPAVHRTFLKPDGSGKADVSPAKMMLGPVRGGGVYLSPKASTIVVGEGIETTLSAQQLLKLGPACFVAALSTSGIAGFNIPSGTERLIVAVDGDTPGQEAASKLLRRADDAGIRASWIAAPAGRDFNDILQERANA